MKFEHRGMSIGIESASGRFYLSLKVTGKLTHADYEKITPLIDSVLNVIKEPSVKVLIDITEFEGWELRAAWDDFKLGLKYGNDFEKIAIFGNKNWEKIAAKITSWFISGEARYFDNKSEAVKWLTE